MAAVGATAVTAFGTAAHAASDGRLSLPDRYPDRVNFALSQGADHWGSQLLELPDGPTLKNVESLLVPANHGGPTVADSPWSYLPFTYPAPDPGAWSEQRDFSLQVADGSELLSQWSDQRASQRVKFAVGPNGDERFGSAEARSRTPKLGDGYLPILINRYTDASGVTYERESFAARLEPGGPVVSLVRFTATATGPDAPDTAHLEISVQTSGIERASAQDHVVSVDGKTVLAYSGDAGWKSPALTYDLDVSDGPATAYLVIANQPAAMPPVTPSKAVFEQSRDRVSDYWRTLLQAGAHVDVPEPYVVDAMRNMLLANLVMGFNLTVGNGYESLDKTFAFVPEVAATVTSLGDFGYRDRFRANLDELIKRGQGSGFFVTWEHAIKLQTAATYYLQTNDRSFVLEHLDTFKGWLAEFARQRDADPYGLLAKTRYASDIPEPVYGIHHQSEAWRGLRDMGVALKLMGHPDAQIFLGEASELRAALLDAIDQSKTVLPDGSIFVPIGLMDETPEQPYERLTDTTLGSYWNLIMPYALATGILEPQSETAIGLRKYLYEHGSLFLGLTRFNLSGADPGVCNTVHAPAWPAAPGYKSSGIDQQYGYSLMRHLADAGESDRLNLSFYGMLGAGFTPNTFIGGEGATVSPCPHLGEYYRSQYWPPLSPNNATFLEALRAQLIQEDLDDEGVPAGLQIAPATPRSWLRDGQRIGVRGLPTSFGPVDYKITSHLADGYVTARIDPPQEAAGRASLRDVTLRLRVPAGNRLARVKVDGRAVPFDGRDQSVDLGDLSGPVTVRADYDRRAVRSAPRARVTTVETARTLLEPGEKPNLGVEVEMLGEGHIRGRLEVSVPSGWSVSTASVPFAAHSRGQFIWRRVPVKLRVPDGAAPGEYVVRLTARPDGGPAHTTDFRVRVTVPASASYADLVRQRDPAGYWRLDETSQDEPVRDASGGGNAGTVRGKVELSAPGAIADDPDTALRLDGGFVEIPDAESLSLTGPYTLEAWVKDIAAGPQGVIEKYEGGDCLPSRDGYALRLVEGNKLQAINVADQGYGSAPSERSVQQNEWHHVVSVYDGSTLRLYLDGRLQSSTVVAKAPTDGRGTLKLGARGDDAGVPFDGWLDEVAVYDTALTADQVDSHYVKGVLGDRNAGVAGEQDVAPAASRAASTTRRSVVIPDLTAEPPGGPTTSPMAQLGSGAAALTRTAAVAEDAASTYAEQVLALDPVGYWRLGEPSGARAEDASAAGGDGSYVGGVALGRPGALAGDADTSAELTGGYVSVPDSGPVSVTGPFTLEAWVNLTDVCRQYSVVEKYDTPAFNGYVLRVLPGGGLNALTLAGEGGLASVGGRSIVTPHVWHHVAAVYDGTTLSVYLDGRLDGSLPTSVVPRDGATSLKLGARGDDAGTRLAGGLDEVAIYDRALTAAEIEQHHTTGAGG